MAQRTSRWSMPPNPTDQFWLNLLSCRSGIGSTREEPGEALSDAHRYASSRHGGYWGRGAVNSRRGPAHLLNPICSQPRLLHTSLASLTMGDTRGSDADEISIGRERVGRIGAGRTGLSIRWRGPRHASRLRAERRRVHRAGSRGPQHRRVSRETRAATDDASPVAARHEGRHLPSCKPAKHSPARNQPAHSVELRLPTRGPVSSALPGRHVADGSRVVVGRHRYSASIRPAKRVSTSLWGGTPESASCSDCIDPRTEGRQETRDGFAEAYWTAMSRSK